VPRKKKNAQCAPSAIGFVQPLIANFPLVDQVLPALPASGETEAGGSRCPGESNIFFSDGDGIFCPTLIDIRGIAGNHHTITY